jgi:RNase P/RNase MRP subunit p30
MDLYFCFNNKTYGIKLKYKTVSVNNGRFDFIDQDAQNNGKYGYRHDIARLEKYRNVRIIDEAIYLGDRVVF